MDLKLKFIGVNECDVIATSTKLCSYSGLNDSYKYSNGTGGTYNYYAFKDEGDRPCGTFGGQFIGTIIIDTKGNNVGNVVPTIGQHYHYDDIDNKLYECNDPSHYGSSE